MSFSSFLGEGNGNSLPCSCLENPRDGSLVGCRLWGHTDLDTAEATQHQQQHPFSMVFVLLFERNVIFVTPLCFMVVLSFYPTFICQQLTILDHQGLEQWKRWKCGWLVFFQPTFIKQFIPSVTQIAKGLKTVYEGMMCSVDAVS